MSTQNKDVTVEEVMLEVDSFPVISSNTILKEALEKMDDFHLGVACVVAKNNQLLGILTDGDIRRKLLSVQRPLSSFFIDDVIEHSIRSPVVVSSNTILIKAVDLMEKSQVWDLPVVDEGKLVGLLHLHQAIKKIL